MSIVDNRGGVMAVDPISLVCAKCGARVGAPCSNGRNDRSHHEVRIRAAKLKAVK